MSDVMRTESAPPPAASKSVLRQLIVFEAKLALDGLKDIVLAPLAIIAALWDLALDGGGDRQRLLGVFNLGISFERWLNLYDHETIGVEERTTFGAAGSDLLIDQIEDLARGAHDSLATAHGERKLRRRDRGTETDGSD